MTVAGTYQEGMAPDLRMRLSFPKPSSSNESEQQMQSADQSRPTINYDNGNLSFLNEDIASATQHALLPLSAVSPSADLNHKRNITRHCKIISALRIAFEINN